MREVNAGRAQQNLITSVVADIQKPIGATENLQTIGFLRVGGFMVIYVSGRTMRLQSTHSCLSGSLARGLSVNRISNTSIRALLFVQVGGYYYVIRTS